jgi:glutamate N-acetyltransferase/amino-acid N-acetyltransferase
MKVLKKVILPNDFKANGLSCGIKKSARPDLALIYSGRPAKAAALFTQNKIQAAPIQVDRKHLRTGRGFRAVIINSGNANAFTGYAGLKDARNTAIYLAKSLGMKKENVLVASTGIIGKRLPLEKIRKAIPGLVKGLRPNGIDAAARAIMTTDTFPKETAVKFRIGKKTITICGIAKGAGMIAPNTATMLCFIITDANISQFTLKKALKIAVEGSFHSITIDGCMSTNDTVAILANGASANPMIDTKKHFDIFLKALKRVCLELAKMIIRDAEGATKFIQIKVSGAKIFPQAKKVALSIANSSLFKTAMFGENPNFGRIVAAVGASGINVKEKDLKIKVGSLKKKEINVDVFIGRGKSSAIVYTSDLTPGYIKINAEYN